MLNLLNADKKTLVEYVKCRTLFIIGAGRRLKSFDENNSDCALESYVTAFADNDSNKQNKKYSFYHRNIPVYSVTELSELVDDNSVIIIASRAYDELIEQLDLIRKFDKCDCFILSYVENHYEIDKNLTNYINISRYKAPQIPKVIHYCWLGGNDFSELEEKCMASWKKYCPDYEIVRWDESNYDWTKNPFMKRAFEEKVWGYVPDYARLDIIHKFGGFYFDTDVEIVKSLDELAFNRAFSGVEWGDNLINFGQGFGAVQDFDLLEELMDSYDDDSLLYDAKGVRIPSPYVQTKVLRQYGYNCDGKSCITEKGMMIYPSQFFCARNINTMAVIRTPQTYSIHHFEGTWATREAVVQNDYRKELAKNIGTRMKELH